jgi:DNA-binding GntR family transcriptional regulator
LPTRRATARRCAARCTGHAEAVVSPTVADRDLARLLDVMPGTPLQHLRQVDYDDAGQPVMLSREWHVPSVIELSVYRRGPGPVS